jgi:flagellar motor protein MotB
MANDRYESQVRDISMSVGIRAVLLIALLGTIGCQRSQPNLLGTVPNYLKPYSPGAPLVFPDATAAAGASTGTTAPVTPQVAAMSPALGSPSGGSAPGLTALGTLPSPPASDPNSFAYAAQISELDRRARLLDENNRQLHSLLAQAQQQVQTYRERSDLMQQQLGDMSAQLQQARMAANPATSSPMASSPMAPNPTGSNPTTYNPKAMAAATPPSVPTPIASQPPSTGGLSDTTRRSGARLTANTSRGLEPVNSSSLEPLRLLGYPLETNGTAIRLRIPADQLFQPGSSQWTQSAGSLLDRVSSALRTASPNGQLSIDSYTDNSGQASLGTLTALELTGQQAGAIQKYLIAKGGWNASAVTPQAGGSDLPIMDNQTPAGRAANRRIEFIITQDR